MTTESNQPIHITQSRLLQLAAEVNLEVVARRRARQEEIAARIRAERKAAKLANWNKRLPRGGGQ